MPNIKPIGKKVSKAGKTTFLLFLLVLSTQISTAASQDSLKVKEPKHYIRPCLYFNSIALAERKVVASNLDNVKFHQSNIGFYFPMLTKTWHKNDTILPSFQLLGTLNVLGGAVKFTSLIDNSNHRIKKGSVGLRGIYANGQRNTWFVNVSPFVAQENALGTSARTRLATVVVFNRTVSPKFSYRIGYSKSFIFGNNYHLPIIGFRFGRLDATYVNIQLLRNISVNFPIGNKCSGSVFSKPIGGIYMFKNTNSSFSNQGKVIQFGRYDILSGFQLNYRAGRNFSMFASSGISSAGKISFIGNTVSRNNLRPESPFKTYRTAPTLFVNIGISLYFGKSKSINNNYQMYDALDMNNSYDPGDNNMGPGSNNGIPNPNQTIKNLQYRDVQDLIQDTDLY